MSYDYAVIGGGIVGLATASALQRARPGCSVVVVEKEPAVARHQTGHNSGVIHAGVYYPPGSLKATLCRAGAKAMQEFCAEEGIEVRVPGKLVVATTSAELTRMDRLLARATENGIDVVRVGAAELAELEPNVAGLGALLVRASGIVDYVAVSAALRGRIEARGAEVVLGAEVTAIGEDTRSVTVVAGGRTWTAARAIVCGGLQADRLARLAGLDVDFRIVPFRGEYYRLRPDRAAVVTRMIYPVPDPNLPFLGIHLTPTVDGGVTVGPNAVLGLARERYAKTGVSLRDVGDYARYAGMWRLARSHLRVGAAELRNSLWKRAYLRECRRYCPSLTSADLLPHGAGIRAQAVRRDGSLVDDFLIARTARTLHVCNAPSPAATSAIALGELIARTASE
ncbi:MAG TPA: L-2-hydroxyglutarate oxidase [Pseudonocardiaceae bacterium]|nr:L-2-hydroxyglutarate oxidase [Pseudonocardiaceae bacterium]